MIYVGIDVAKDKHDCHIFDSNGAVLCDFFSFPNSKEGFEEFLSLATRLAKNKPDKLKFGLEDTGHYSTNLIHFLNANNLDVVRFNPLSVSRSRAALTLRKTKTDRNDARYIARLLASHTVNYCNKPSRIMHTLKSLTRARYRLVKELQPLKNRYRRLIHLLFPEIQGFFSNLYGQAPLNLLALLPGAQPIASCDIRRLTSILKSFSRGRHGKEKAENLKALAKKSIAFHGDGDAFELTLIAKRIMFYQDQIATLESEIINIMKTINSPITTIPGIGYVLGAIILAEIGDIHAFDSPSKLLAFAGCEPSTYQSGKFSATNTPMVKRGSRYLRNALYLATNMAYLHSHVFRVYIDKKRSQGKHFYTAISHGIKKLSRVIFAILSQNSVYCE